jgi:alcohol dehydrogenase class IV
VWFFRSPRLIVFGEDALSYLEEVQGKNAFVVTDKVMAKIGTLDRITEKLKKAGMKVAYFDGVLPEPPETVVFDCLKLMRPFQPDVIVGLGGGSCIDVAKTASVLYEHPDMPIDDITPLTPITVKKTTLIGIPTTSGTGSDATWAAVITESKTHRKMVLVHPVLVPVISILDPDLTKTAPQATIAAVGMDALDQAIESYTVQWRNDFSDAFAIHSIKLILKYLPLVFKNPENFDARDKLHNAATMSGAAFSNAQVGIAHSFGHAMGGLYRLPHGVCVGMMLPHSIEYGMKTNADLYGHLAREIGVASASDTDAKAALKLRDVVRELQRQLKMPLSLKEAGITPAKFKESFDELVSLTEQDPTNILNCREPSNEDIRRMWQYVYDGKTVDF